MSRKRVDDDPGFQTDIYPPERARSSRADRRAANAAHDRRTLSSVRVNTLSIFPSSSNAFGFGFFRILLIILLSVGLIRVLMGGSVPTLTSLLSQLSSVPTFDTSWISFSQTTYADAFPFGFQWLGAIFDAFSNIFSLLQFAAVGLINVLLYLLYFIRWVFVA